MAPQVPAPGQVRWIFPFRDNAAHGDRSRDDGVVFERDGAIHITRPELFTDQCITCGAAELGGEVGAPVWHPSGAFLAFTSQTGIWFWRRAEKSFQHVLSVGKHAQDLRFSRDGHRLAWISESKVMIGDCDDRTLAQVRSVSISRPVAELDDFAADGTGVLVSVGDAILQCAIERSACVELVREPGQRLDHARLTPGGRRLLFASTKSQWNGNSDYWLVDLSARNGHLAAPQRMTWFNEVQNPHYIPEVNAGYGSWTTDGLWLLATVTSNTPRGGSRMFMIQFPEPE